MVIEAVLNLIYNIIESIFTPINIPNFDSATLANFSTFLGYLDYGAVLFKIFLPISFNIYFVIFLAIFAFDKLYPFVMWILRKIPFLGIQ